MTCIVGIKTTDNVYIGGDTFGSNGHTGESYLRPKVFKKGNMIIGVCGSYRLMQILEFCLELPKKYEGISTEKYLYIDFINAVRTTLKANGLLAVDKGVESMDGGIFLMGYEGELYKVQQDLSILMPASGYASVGSGCDHAKASLFSTEGLLLDPKERIVKAIECANNFVVSVNGENNIISLI